MKILDAMTVCIQVSVSYIKDVGRIFFEATADGSLAELSKLDSTNSVERDRKLMHAIWKSVLCGPNYPQLSFDNILSWLDVAEAAFRDLNITDDRSSLEILKDSLDIDGYVLIEDIFHIGQFARTGKRYTLL